MEKMKFPIYEMENNKFRIVVNTTLYSKESIIAACYKFSDTCYIFQQPKQDNDSDIEIIFESKDNNLISDELPKKFCNELIDQQIRYNTNLQFGKIRDIIVEQAFKPINNK